MNADLAASFRKLGPILAVCPCPCCQSIFYVSESRPFLVGKRPSSIVDRLRLAERRIEEQQEALMLIESELREKAAKAGLRATKKLLKKIDPVFSGSGYDPQDVKVIFSPVTYVVFDGLSSANVEKIKLLAHRPQDAATEKIQRSIERTIQNGNFEFRVLRVNNEGQVSPE